MSLYNLYGNCLQLKLADALLTVVVHGNTMNNMEKLRGHFYAILKTLKLKRERLSFKNLKT